MTDRGPRRGPVLAVFAHPDDAEIAAGGTLLTLAARHPGLQVRYVLMTGKSERQLEARAAARAFTPGADLAVKLHDLPEGRLRAFELGRGLQWEKSRVSRQVARMAERGLVAREAAPEDGRGAYVVLTRATQLLTTIS